MKRIRFKRGSIFLLLFISVTLALYLKLVGRHPPTSLYLEGPATDGTGEELWFELRSSRMLSFISTEYAIEAQTVDGLTNYNAPPFGNVRVAFSAPSKLPIRVTVPATADSFRVKVN